MMIIKNIYDSCLFKMMVILCKMHFIIKSLVFEIHFYGFFSLNFFFLQSDALYNHTITGKYENTFFYTQRKIVTAKNN